MSEVNNAPLWYPPSFPEQGRLPSVASLTRKNCRQQDSQERAYHNELCLTANRRVAPPCCKTLHISLFFDGTGNNLNHDLNIADPKHPTNIARLFRATVGQGYAAGLAGDMSLTDLPETAGNKYYKYYMPGVGTPFPEIMDLDFTMGGLAFASHGEDRINWGLLRIIDALQRTTGLGKMDDGECWASVQAMSSAMMSFGLTGSSNRYSEFQRLLKSPPLHSRLKAALNPGEPGKVRLLGIKLYIYGFSRGAAAARAFVSWLSELFPASQEGQDKPEQCLMAGDLKIPLSVEFLGLLDTVASVGIPHIAPIAEGHMGWADGNQELPEEKKYGGLITRCVHLVSSHEQRLCFPLDSIRRTDGTYPTNSVEVIYPGMHSDIGGGYPPGDQGKANGPDDALLLSQIALHDIYAAAFACGAPFKVPQEAIPNDLKKDQWRVMPEDVDMEYYVSQEVISRFNAWRTRTLNLTASEDYTDSELASQFTPAGAPMSLESAMEDQVAWLTSWRIGRYAAGTYKTQRFYRDAAANGLDADSDPEVRKAHEQERADKQEATEKARKSDILKAPKDSFILLTQGPKDFDAALGQTQLRQGAEEFREDYQDLRRDSTQTWYYEPLYALKNTMYLLNTDDEYAEWLRMKTAGESRLKVLFPDTGEAGNADLPSGQVRALFDDQIHDSRAWFMHNAFGSREPWGGYFRYRMIYFGDNCNKSLSPLIVAGWVVGAATLAGGVALAIRQKSMPGKILGVAGIFGAISLEVEAIDILSGKPIPMLPGTELLRSFSQQPGVAVAQQKSAMAEQYLAQQKATINSSWLEWAQSAMT